MILAHKIELKPNNKQLTYFKKACGISKLSWNWGLAKWEEYYKSGEKVDGMILKKEFNSIKKKDFLHKFTTYLTDNFKYISIETLNVKGMMSNRKLSRAILNIGMYEFKRQLSYKAELKGNIILKNDRWFASSKTCPNCGSRN